MVSYQILHTGDEAKWHEYLGAISHKQLVHFPRYARIYERYGDGTGQCFVYECDGGIVLYPFLRRTIEGAPGLTDITTPYGYGGPVYECRKGYQPADLVADFRMAFVDYARETKTISEFVRFHPFLANHEHFIGRMDDVSLHCVNALIDLSIGAEGVFQQYRTSYQQCIRKAHDSGLQVVLVPAPDFIEPFFQLYSASMLRKHQEGYFKFRRDFLIDLSEELNDDLKCFAVMHQGNVIAVALFLHFRGYLDYFLAASNPATLSLHPNHLLVHEVALWAIGNGVRWFHLGGGHKSLQFFKRGFANRSCEYYTGKCIYDRDAYNRLSMAHWGLHNRAWNENESYFPGYRAEFPAE